MIAVFALATGAVFVQSNHKKQKEYTHSFFSIQQKFIYFLVFLNDLNFRWSSLKCTFKVHDELFSGALTVVQRKECNKSVCTRHCTSVLLLFILPVYARKKKCIEMFPFDGWEEKGGKAVWTLRGKSPKIKLQSSGQVRPGGTILVLDQLNLVNHSAALQRKKIKVN